MAHVQAGTVSHHPSGDRAALIVDIGVAALIRPHVVISGVAPSRGEEITERVAGALGASNGAEPDWLWCGRHALRTLRVDVGRGGEHATPTSLDLAIAVGILAATAAIPAVALEGVVFWGALGLDGALRAPRGALAVARRVRDLGLTLVCPSSEVQGLLRWLPDLRVAGAVDLEDLIAGLREGLRLAEPLAAPPPPGRPSLGLEDGAWSPEVVDTAVAAVAARKPLLLTSSPGCGAAMLAARLPGIMPAMTDGERLDVATRASLTGLEPDAPAVMSRPFRAPHYSVTFAGLRAEAELARGGVLLLCDVEFFSGAALDYAFCLLPADVLLVCSSHAPEDLSRVRGRHPFRFEAALALKDGRLRGQTTKQTTTAEARARVAAAWADAGTAHTGATPAP